MVTVSHVVTLRGPGIRKEPAYLSISTDLINEVADAALNNNAFLVGQIHSHGEGYGVNLSDTDKRHGFSVPGYLSAVAPDYAMRPNTRIGDCGFHLYQEGKWHRLSTMEVWSRIQLVDEPTRIIQVVG